MRFVTIRSSDTTEDLKNSKMLEPMENPFKVDFVKLVLLHFAVIPDICYIPIGIEWGFKAEI